MTQQFEQIQKLCQADMQAVNGIILQRLKSEVALINQLGLYIIGAGGKRMRPMLTVLCGRALGTGGEKHQLLATIVEFIHTATLLHDDVVDESDLRRGCETANALFGAQASVLVGDYLYTRAFQMMVELENMRVMDMFSATTNTIAEGEVMQLMNCNDPDIGENDYMAVISAKTAALFAAATSLSGVIAAVDEKQIQALERYGCHLGNAFQLVDDALDYSSSAEELGKNIGDDLAEGKPTLPLIIAQNRGSAEQKKIIRRAIETGGLENMAEIQQAITQTGALQYTLERAKQEAAAAQGAISILQPSAYRDALTFLAHYSVERRN